MTARRRATHRNALVCERAPNPPACDLPRVNSPTHGHEPPLRFRRRRVRGRGRTGRTLGADAEFVRQVTAFTDTAVACTVRCHVELDRSLPSEPIAGIQIYRDGAVTRVACDELRVEITPDGEGRFRARARVAATRLGSNAVVLGVSAAALQLAGGLHCSVRPQLTVVHCCRGPRCGKSTALGAPGCRPWPTPGCAGPAHARSLRRTEPAGAARCRRWCEPHAPCGSLRVRQGADSCSHDRGARRLSRSAVGRIADPRRAGPEWSRWRIAAACRSGELGGSRRPPGLLRELLAGRPCRAGRDSSSSLAPPPRRAHGYPVSRRRSSWMKIAGSSIA